MPCSGPSSALWTMYAGMPVSRRRRAPRRRRRSTSRGRPAAPRRPRPRPRSPGRRSRRRRRRRRSSRCPAITAAATKQRLQDDHQERRARPGSSVAVSEQGDVAEHRGEHARRRRPPSSRPAPGSGSRVGTSASRPPARQHDAQPPGRPELAEPADHQVEGVDRRASAAGRCRAPAPRRRRCSSAGSHHGASSTGTTPTATAGGPHTERSAISARQRSGTRRRARPARAGAKSQATGAERGDQREQQPGAPGRPPAPVGVRVGEAERGVGQPGQQRRGTRPARAVRRPRRRLTTGTRAYVAAPQSISQRGAPGGLDQPADHPEEPPRAPQRERHGEHEQRRHAAEVAAEQGGEQRERQRGTAAPGRRCPSASGCQDSRCSRHQSPADVGRRREPAAGHVAERRPGPPTSASTTNSASTTRDRVGEEPGREAGVDVLRPRRRGAVCRRGGHRRAGRARRPRPGAARRRRRPGWSRRPPGR